MGWKFILRSEWLGWGQTCTLTLNVSPLGKERRLPGGRDAGVMGGGQFRLQAGWPPLCRAQGQFLLKGGLTA